MKTLCVKKLGIFEANINYTSHRDGSISVRLPVISNSGTLDFVRFRARGAWADDAKSAIAAVEIHRLYELAMLLGAM